jgi:hypothetical protein
MSKPVMMRLGLAVTSASLVAVVFLAIRVSNEAEELQRKFDEVQSAMTESEDLRDAEAMQTVLAIQSRIERDKSSLDHSDQLGLRASLVVLDRRIQAVKETGGSRDDLIRACAGKATIEWLLRDFGQCREALETAVNEIELTLPADRSIDAELTYLDIRNSLGCLFAWMGQFGDAERVLRRNIGLLDELSLSMPMSPAILWMQARGRLNLGVTAILLGGDGANDLVAGAERARQMIPEDAQLADVNSLYIAEITIDAFYFAGQRAVARRQLNEAQELWSRAQDVLRRLRKHSLALRTQIETEHRFVKYRWASDDIKADLQTLAAKSISRTDSATGRLSDWKWSGVNDGRSMSLVPIDLTVQGKLAAEFERQDAILFQWPDLAFGRTSLLEAIKAVQETTPVIVGVRDGSAQLDLENGLAELEIPRQQIRITPLPASTIWMRDFGPLTRT